MQLMFKRIISSYLILSVSSSHGIHLNPGTFLKLSVITTPFLANTFAGYSSDYRNKAQPHYMACTTFHYRSYLFLRLYYFQVPPCISVTLYNLPLSKYTLPV